jgi:hypothetical protein
MTPDLEPVPEPQPNSVLQPWVETLPLTAQLDLVVALRSPDGITIDHATEPLLRWLRRCVLRSPVDGRVLTDPLEPTGGALTGPSLTGREDADWRPGMDGRLNHYLRTVDALPHGFVVRQMRAAEIVAYKHPKPDIAAWWLDAYTRTVHRMNLWPEYPFELEARLLSQLMPHQRNLAVAP